jgi:quinol monooxygenase YgiN
MVHLLIKHRVKDYDAWKKEFDGFADFRRKSGEKSYEILQPLDDPNNLTLLFEWDDRKNAETFFSSPELKNTMQRAGVAEEPKIQMMREVAHGTL